MLNSCIRLSQYDRCSTQRPEKFRSRRPFQIHQSALEPRRAATGCQALIGEFETAGVIGISLVAESSTDHIEKAVCTNSAWIFSETAGGMKFKFGEEIEQQLSDR